jgi:Ca2+-transporting ATPase
MTLAACDRIQVAGKVRKLTPQDRKRIHSMNLSFADQALRVLALAYREVKPGKRYTVEGVEKDLIFLGLVGMIDPPREEVAEAVAECHAAGIETMVITGDHAITAKAVARQIGMFKEGDIALTGEEIDRMTDAELDAKISRVRIIARSLPIQKSRIVASLQRKGHVVAMTGDGVNDAPALKKADIGIAMGITGTDVAKEVSKAILVDDNFATIVKAVKEGRNIYDKIVKSTRYLLSCNMGEIVSVFLAIALQFPLPLIPLQILLMNLLTDGLPAMGLGMEPSEEDAMARPPRDPKESPLTRQTLVLVLLFGLIMGAGTLYMFYAYLPKGLELAQTVAFTTLVMFEMFAVVGSRSLHAFRHANPLTNLWLLGGIAGSVLIQALVIYAEPLRPVFGTVPLAAFDWARIVAIAALGYVLMEAGKLFIPQPN